MAKPLIPVATIYDAALELLETQGADALTARNLAAALKCSTRTLYQQVGKRDDLVGQLVAHYLAGQQLKFEAGSSWQEAIQNWAFTLRKAILDHPNLARLMTVEHRRAVATYVNELLKVLLRHGLDEELALKACRVVANVTLSLSLSEVIAPSEDHRKAPRGKKEIAFETRIRSRHPEQASDLQQLSSVFETTIAWLLIGLKSNTQDGY